MSFEDGAEKPPLGPMETGLAWGYSGLTEDDLPSTPGASFLFPTILVEQAEGMDRPEVMRKVVGPALTEFFRPLYDDLTPEEAAGLPDIKKFSRIELFATTLDNLIFTRFTALKSDNQMAYSALDRLGEVRLDLFHYQNINSVLTEALLSGIVAPLTLARSIYAVENFDRGTSREEIKTSELSAADLLEVMQREEFDRMLASLTKGPNGFLGSSSSAIQAIGKSFFDFEGSSVDLLSIWDAFKVKDGKVVGFSDDYHLAAQAKRRQIGDRYSDAASRFSPKHDFANSSGCPVRHRFEDETGEKQESLVITAKNFLLQALEASNQQKQAA